MKRSGDETLAETLGRFQSLTEEKATVEADLPRRIDQAYFEELTLYFHRETLRLQSRGPAAHSRRDKRHECPIRTRKR